MKATAVLFPLLGLTNVLFIFAPGDWEGNPHVMAYRITNAVLQSSQVECNMRSCFVSDRLWGRQVFIRKQ